MNTNKYKPQGMNFSAEQSDFSLAALEKAKETGRILEAVASVCTPEMSLKVNLGSVIGIIPKEEAVLTQAGEEIKDIAVITRVGKPVCFKITGFEKRGGTTVALLSRRLAALGLLGQHGFFDALDCTRARTGGGGQIVRCVMAHHQGMSLLAACNALLDVAGFRAVDEDAYGRPVLRRYREPQDRPVSMTLREGSGARFINEVVDELDRSGVANVVHCDYETQDAFYRGTAIDSDPSSPYSTVSRGWRKTATYSYSDLPEGSTDAERQRNADAKANEMLRTQQSAIRRVTVKRTYAPIACGDAVMVDWASAGISGKFAVRTATLTLVGGCPIEMEVKRYER